MEFQSYHRNTSIQKLYYAQILCPDVMKCFYFFTILLFLPLVSSRVRVRRGEFCGSGLVTSTIVPDRISLIGCQNYIELGPCCQKHDICYGECGRIKSNCDSDFYDDIKSECNRHWGYCYLTCMAAAMTYYTAVAAIGYPAFENSQLECN